MQSGQGNMEKWLLEYEPEQPRSIDPLMGWTSSGDMRQQVRLQFDTRDEALDYARRNGLAAMVEEPHDPKRRTISYSDNFKFNRQEPWTH